MKESSPFYLVADSLIEELAERQTFGLKNEVQAAERLEKELKSITAQLKQAEKMAKNVKASFTVSNPMGCQAYLPKVEECFVNLGASVITAATIVRRLRQHYKG